MSSFRNKLEKTRDPRTELWCTPIFRSKPPGVLEAEYVQGVLREEESAEYRAA